MRGAASYHLKYAFQRSGSSDETANGTYQGVGLSYYDFGNPEGLGNPYVVYIFQGSPIVRFSKRLSLNYEWNFGVSFGWKPYHKTLNPTNKVIGSKVNAYMNADIYMNWKLNRLFDVNIGLEGTHFSNGNTQYPNLGLNTAGIRTSLVYYFNRSSHDYITNSHPKLPNQLSYDLMFFASWHRVGVAFHDGLYLAPSAYPVLGFSFSPMYRISGHFKAGLSLDGVYDGGSSIQGVERNEIVPYNDSGETGDYGFDIVKPPFKKQLSLGLSARGEFVMPYFSINLGLGGNVLNSNRNLKFFYQTLTLKVDLFRGSYLNIGYNLKNFQEPNYLMLGIGYRFRDHRQK